VLPNFIDLSNINDSFTDCQRELMASTDEMIITHVSNLRPVKRVRDVIEIFDRIQKKIPAKLLIVGEGPERGPCELLCEQKGITDKVVFFGNSNEIDKILCFSDLFLLPSEKESFGLAALEAMASGVPVVSSRAGGLSEVNEHGVSGYLSDIGNVDEMAQQALSILQNPETLARFKQQAKETARRFDTQNIVPLYEAVYELAMSTIK
jgi:N-acetyl-alpha-D-glucosaminyl L-malate synthase BshA